MASRPLNGSEDCTAVCGSINNIRGSFSSSLPVANVYRGNCKRRCLHNATAGIAQKNVGVPQQAPIGRRVQVHEYFSVSPRSQELFGPLNERAAASIRVGIAKKKLADRKSTRLNSSHV